ncbi:hypothetical protein NBE98_18650 [Clostridium swellfunianum]|uniref:hypothetical protein n=1 Tax=Clostridium swellfunianum TaxID=1367462 RepID=UPI0020305BB0|nr:hypothetical protein [Clostridium swellfunianum]MCM0650385.1 hypothetical protein [Clostridium swellfunianum]
MYKYKNKSIAKGYIALYVIFVCSLCIILAAYSFTLEIRRARTTNSLKNSILKINKVDEYKECGFTYLTNGINSSISSLSLDSVRQYLKASGFKIVYGEGKACIKYDLILDKIVLQTYYDSEFIRQDLYDYKIISDKLIYEYISTKYIEGRVQ